ncbi:MAG: hypothetical protein JW840_02555 [Candidatus Thermoplasmatota archaeon]|nr:hypothetical protein [Candidatus Thermoplasmatota archaeon]
MRLVCGFRSLDARYGSLPLLVMLIGRGRACNTLLGSFPFSIRSGAGSLPGSTYWLTARCGC